MGRETPVERSGGVRVARGQCFVDVDPEAGQLVRPEHPVAELWRAGEDLPRERAETVRLLDAEIRAGEVGRAKVIVAQEASASRWRREPVPLSLPLRT